MTSALRAEIGIDAFAATKKAIETDVARAGAKATG